jgi:phage/plasmid-like protein (TIGR03299 family)
MAVIDNSKSGIRTLVGFKEDIINDYWGGGARVSRYEGAVPLDDVLGKLFNWDAIRCSVEVVHADGRRLPFSGREAIVHSKTDKVVKVATDSYVIHQYQDWLVNNVAKLLGDDLCIGIAGVLRGGGGAFIAVETPDKIESRNGIELKPKLLAASSHDSRLATSYKMVGTILRCQNMLSASLWHESAPWNNRHTLNSLVRLEEVRETLGIQLAKNAAAMCDFVDSLVDISVTDDQWQEIVERLVPIPEGTRPQLKSRQENKRVTLHDMWVNDPRCTEWKGSGFGVFQVFNTFQLHTAGKNDARVDRNMRNILSNVSLDQDENVIAVLQEVCNA